MSNNIQIKEKYSRYWPHITWMSTLLAVVFYISYHLSTHVLVEGYFRLIAFGFFAIAILSFLKVKDGQIEISIHLVDGRILDLVYKVRNRMIYHEEFLMDDFDTFKIDQLPDRSLYNNIMKSDRCIRFKRKDTGAWHYLNQVHGRVVPLSEESAVTILNFLDRKSREI